MLTLTLNVLYTALAGEPPPTPVDQTWLQYGVVGILAAGGLTFGLRTHRRVLKEREQAIVDLARIHEAHSAEVGRLREAHAAELRTIYVGLQERQIPLLTDAARVLSEVSVQLQRRERR